MTIKYFMYFLPPLKPLFSLVMVILYHTGEPQQWNNWRQHRQKIGRDLKPQKKKKLSYKI